MNNPAKEQWEEMREERKNNDQDPALQTPGEANTDKHINFTESEEDEPGSGTYKEMREERMNNDRDTQ